MTMDERKKAIICINELLNLLDKCQDSLEKDLNDDQIENAMGIKTKYNED